MLWMTHGKKTIEAEPPILDKCPTFFFLSRSCMQFARTYCYIKCHQSSWSKVLAWSGLLMHKLLGFCTCALFSISQRSHGAAYAESWATVCGCCCFVSVLSFHCLASGKASDKGASFPVEARGPRGLCVCMCNYCTVTGYTVISLLCVITALLFPLIISFS